MRARGVRLARTEAHALSMLAAGAPGAMTYRSFVARLEARALPDLVPASGYTTRLLAGEALARAPAARLPLPEEPAARVALARAVDLALGRLRRAGTTAAHLAATGSKTGLLLADVLIDVDAALAKEKLYDERGGASLLAARLAAQPFIVREGSISIAGMIAWEPAEAALLEALHVAVRAAGGRGLTLELPTLAGALAATDDGPIANVAEELERRWASLLDPPEIAWSEIAGGAPTAVIAARDLEGEARAVTARVLEAVERGTAPERIAVVVPDLDEPRLAPLRAGFADAGLPFSEPRGRPAGSCPEARIVLTLLAMADGAVTRDRAIEILRAPGLDPSPWMDRGAGDAHRRAVAIAHRLREVPVEVDRTGRLLVDALTEASLRRPDEAWMARSLDRMLRDVRWTAASVSSVSSGASGALAAPRAEIAGRLMSLLDRVSLGKPAMSEISRSLSSSPTAALGRAAAGNGAAAVRAVREALRSIVDGARAAGLAASRVTAGELAAELAMASEELGVGVATGEAGAVRIARPLELAGQAHDLVVVMGLAGGAYAGSEGYAFLDERTRRALPAASRPASPRQREARCRAELVWTMAGASAVVLTHTAAEGALGTVHDLVRWARATGAVDHEEPASRVARGASRTGQRSAELIALANGAAPSRDIAERAAAERTRMAFFLDPRSPAGAHTGRVEVPDPRKLIAAVGGDEPGRPIAVTAIERAAGCAFAGFARRVLRVRRVDELVEVADARDRGTLVHRALHAAFEGAREAPLPLASERARDHAARALGLGGALTPLRREVIVTAIDDAVAVVERALDPAEGFRLVSAEQRFGPAFSKDEGRAWEALALEGLAANDPVVYVDGQIDRVDVSRDGRRARVVDYKTGRAPAAGEHGKRVFQLALYARAAARTLGCTEVEAVYVSVRARGVLQEWPRATDDRLALGSPGDDVIQSARRVVLAMWGGDAAPRPAAASLCTRCDVRDICRRPAVAPVEEAD